MYFNAIRKNKILAKISESTIHITDIPKTTQVKSQMTTMLATQYQEPNKSLATSSLSLIPSEMITKLERTQSNTKHGPNTEPSQTTRQNE